MLCALLVSPPERTVWTLPRNYWWARDVTASIDINAWPNEMFPLNQLTVCFVSFVSSMTIFLSVVSAEEHASASEAMAIECRCRSLGQGRIVVSADVVIF